MKKDQTAGQIISPENSGRSWLYLRHLSGMLFPKGRTTGIFAFQTTKTIKNEKVSIDFFECVELVFFGVCSKNIRRGKG